MNNEHVAASDNSVDNVYVVIVGWPEDSKHPNRTIKLETFKNHDNYIAKLIVMILYFHDILGTKTAMLPSPNNGCDFINYHEIPCDFINSHLTKNYCEIL